MKIRTAQKWAKEVAAVYPSLKTYVRYHHPTYEICQSGQDGCYETRLKTEEDVEEWLRIHREEHPQ